MQHKNLQMMRAALLVFLVMLCMGQVSSAVAQGQSNAGTSGIIPGMPSFPRQIIPTLPGLPPGGDQMQPPPVFDQRSLADLPGQSRGTERVGSSTQAEGGPTLVTPLGDLQRAAGPAFCLG